MFLPYLGILILIFKAKNNLFSKLIYTYIVSDFFNQLHGGLGFKFLFFNNFTFYDFLGLISVGLVLYKLFGSGKQRLITINSTTTFIVRLIVFILFYLILLIIISFYIHGSSGIQAHRMSIYSLFFLGSFVFLNSKEIHYDKLLLSSLRLLVISSIFFYLFRSTGIIEYYAGAGSYGADDTYSKYRYLINVQVIYLCLFYIFAAIRKQYGLKLTPVDRILVFLCAFLVITSTQRMVTILFGLFLMYEIVFLRKKGLAFFPFSLLILGFIFLPAGFKSMIQEAFIDVYDYKGSTAESKLKDIPASIIAIYNDGGFLFGKIFAAQDLERSFDDFYSRSTRGIHNLYISYFYNGGILFVFMIVSLWYVVTNKLVKSYVILSSSYLLWDNRSAALTLTCILSIVFLFLFNMSSGIGFLSSFILGFSISSLHKTMYNAQKIKYFDNKLK